MRKIFVLLLLLFTLVGCTKDINVTGKVMGDDNLLPNGVELSLEKEEELFNFTRDFYLNNRSIDISLLDGYEVDDELEIRFIDALKEKYGAEAELYYGEEVISSEINEIPYIYDQTTGKMIPLENSVERIASIDSYYTILSKSICKKHWGLWWQYYTFEVNLTVNSIYSNETFNLKTDRAYYEYTDSVTNNLKGWKDWTKFDNPYENGYPTGDSNIEECNRGVLKVQGNKKTGWLPKVYNPTLVVQWYDDFIRDGVAGVTYYQN